MHPGENPPRGAYSGLFAQFEKSGHPLKPTVLMPPTPSASQHGMPHDNHLLSSPQGIQLAALPPEEVDDEAESGRGQYRYASDTPRFLPPALLEMHPGEAPAGGHVRPHKTAVIPHGLTQQSPMDDCILNCGKHNYG